MAMLKREEILQAVDLKREVVAVPEWGGEVLVQELTARQRVEFEKTFGEDDDSLRWTLVAFSCVDEEGNLLFTKEDVEALAKKSFKAIRRVSDAALRLAKMEPGAVEEARANFAGRQG